MSQTEPASQDVDRPEGPAGPPPGAADEAVHLNYATNRSELSSRAAARRVKLLVAGLVCVALFIWILAAAMKQRRVHELVRRAACSTNLQAISQACHIYGNDYDEWFPPSLQTLIDMGHVTPAALQCPSESNPSGLVFDYVYVPGLQGTVPSDWILAYEDPANHNGEGGNVLYVDGHVEFLKEPEFSAELERVRGEIEESEYGEHPWYQAHPLEVP